MFSFEDPSKIKKVYRLYVSDSIAHIEEYPVAYVNKEYLYAVDHGSNKLLEINTSRIAYSDNVAIDIMVSDQYHMGVCNDGKMYSHFGIWFLNKTESSETTNNILNQAYIVKCCLERKKKDLFDAVQRRRDLLREAEEKYEEFCNSHKLYEDT